MDIKLAFEIVVIVMLLTGLVFVYFNVDILGRETVTESFTDYKLEKARMYEIISATCLNDNVLARPESKKFIFDRNRLDKEQEGTPDISCIDFGATKYRIYIKDLSKDTPDIDSVWMLTNYGPLEYTYDTYPYPQLDQMIQISDSTTPPLSEYEAVDFDIFKKGLVSASFILSESGAGLSDEMYCERDPVERIYIIANSISIDDPIKSSYYYPDNDCASGNCIKGPGQSYATCQHDLNKYDKETDETCKKDYECKSGICISNKCSDSGSPLNRLIVGQPCLSLPGMIPNETCASGYCMYGLTCGCKDNSGCSKAKVCNIRKGVCI